MWGWVKGGPLRGGEGAALGGWVSAGLGGGWEYGALWNIIGACESHNTLFARTVRHQGKDVG